MSDKRKYPTFEEYLAGDVYTTSIINEPYEVDFVAPVVERSKLRLVVNNERTKEVDQ